MRFTKMATAIDAHACGEPNRVIIGAFEMSPVETVFDKKLYLEMHGDELRKRIAARAPRIPTTVL